MIARLLVSSVVTPYVMPASNCGQNMANVFSSLVKIRINCEKFGSYFKSASFCSGRMICNKQATLVEDRSDSRNESISNRSMENVGRKLGSKVFGYPNHRVVVSNYCSDTFQSNIHVSNSLNLECALLPADKLNRQTNLSSSFFRRYSSDSNSMKEDWYNSCSMSDSDKTALRLIEKITEEKLRAERMALEKALQAEKEKLETALEAQKEKLEVQKEKFMLLEKMLSDKVEAEKEKLEAQKDKFMLLDKMLNDKISDKNQELLQLYQIFTPRGLLERFEARSRDPTKIKQNVSQSGEELWTNA